MKNFHHTLGSYHEPIPLKKFQKGDTAWSTRKTILGWYLETEAHLIRLPEAMDVKVSDAQNCIPDSTHRCSLWK